jgi:hypothetical protein
MDALDSGRRPGASDGFTPESLEITGIAGWYVHPFMTREAVLGERFREQSLNRVSATTCEFGGWIVITIDDASELALDAGRRCERM